MKSSRRPSSQEIQSAEPVQETSLFPVVAIGASAGGLEAFTQLIRALPDNTGMAFVLIQHLDPTHHSLLAELLSKAARIPVVEAKNGADLQPNCVYVIPPNVKMEILKGRLQLSPRKKGGRFHFLPIDFFMRSLAEERKRRAVGVVLSGTGSLGPCSNQGGRRRHLCSSGKVGQIRWHAAQRHCLRMREFCSDSGRNCPGIGHVAESSLTVAPLRPVSVVRPPAFSSSTSSLACQKTNTDWSWCRARPTSTSSLVCGIDGTGASPTARPQSAPTKTLRVQSREAWFQVACGPSDFQNHCDVYRYDSMSIEPLSPPFHRPKSTAA